ncbi:hypothetical protein [Rhodopirellula sp. P2]|uniref:hypothetical protein n=1 Tax=Rhodopirellula sp. P2 TaxID=2127060 RepID=UPI0023682588|nr:hypothetical protein [Rhodopirellula sp. P2]WDQ15097.1 hypothetical protein PSR62_15785 [Rhodopirellula sp. P2]
MPEKNAVAEDEKQVLAEINAFESAYGYNADYMKDLFARSPESFRRFVAARPMTMHYDQLPPEAYFTAAIAVMQEEDCRGCLDLNVKMAKEAGVPDGLIEQMVGAPHDLPAELKDVREHTLNCLRGGAIDEQVAHRIERHFGHAAFGELAIAIVGVRIYPGLKRALLKMQSCQIPSSVVSH